MNAEKIQQTNTAIDTSPERRIEIDALRNSIELNPEKSKVYFEKIDISSSEAQMMISSYEALLSNCYQDMRTKKTGDSYVGAGNHAIVLKGPKKEFCLKLSWETLALSKKFNPKCNTDDLPDRIKGLSKVNDYFNAIRETKSKFQGRGAEFKTPNNIEDESKITAYLHSRLKEEGFEGAVPTILSAHRYINEEEGSTENFKSYYISENVHAIRMGFIDGFTVEQLILDQPEEIVGKIDVEKFSLELQVLMDKIHSFRVTHGDISTRNVMIDKNTLKPVMIDFGASRYYPNDAEDPKNNEQVSQEEVNFDNIGIDEIKKKLTDFHNNPIRTRELMRRKHEKL